MFLWKKIKILKENCVTENVTLTFSITINIGLDVSSIYFSCGRFLFHFVVVLKLKVRQAFFKLCSALSLASYTNFVFMVLHKAPQANHSERSIYHNMATNHSALSVLRLSFCFELGQYFCCAFRQQSCSTRQSTFTQPRPQTVLSSSVPRPPMRRSTVPSSSMPPRPSTARSAVSFFVSNSLLVALRKIVWCAWPTENTVELFPGKR